MNNYHRKKKKKLIPKNQIVEKKEMEGEKLSGFLLDSSLTEKEIVGNQKLSEKILEISKISSKVPLKSVVFIMKKQSLKYITLI